MNIVLVIFDSLRKDCIGCYGSPPWGWEVQTPHLNRLAEESLIMTRAYPESLPTLPTRRALYTGRRVYPFHDADVHQRGDFKGAPGWGPIPEEQDTLAELLSREGYRTALIADVPHMFKPSKNYWRGFDQWTYIRGQEIDGKSSGPEPSEELLRHYLLKQFEENHPWWRDLVKAFIRNMQDFTSERDYFNAQVFRAASDWIDENRDAEKFFLTVESFDPHEPWIVPDHYRRMYDPKEGREQIMSTYSGEIPEHLIERTRANYSGQVTMCDRWFGYLYETIRVHGLLENTVLMVTTDHGHSINERGYTGKRGYPSEPAVYDVPVIIRHPEGVGAGRRSDHLIQHTDLTAQILEFAGIGKVSGLDGSSFFEAAVSGAASARKHVTVAWGSEITVIDERWWLNCKVDGSGVLLYDLSSAEPFGANLAEGNEHEVNRLFTAAWDDAAGSFPDYILEMAKGRENAPGCSPLAARKS